MHWGIKKIVFWVILALIGAAVIVCGAAGIKYYTVINGDSMITPPSQVDLSKKQVPLGESVDFSAVFNTTWKSRPVEATLLAGKGVQENGDISIALDKLGWGTCRWRISGQLKPYHTGEVGSSQLTVSFDSAGIKLPRKETVTIPAFQSLTRQVKDAASLTLANRMDEEQRQGRSGLKLWLLISGIAILILLIIIALIWFRRGGTEKKRIIPPWTIALSQLHQLGADLKNGLLSGEACISKLTDIVRFYLEKQFHTHAQTQTTVEFLRELERPGSVLNENHRSFLREFLTAADLVKFANCPADNTLLENAIAKADTLVMETKPKEDEKGGAK